MKIPPDSLSPDTLHRLVEEFVTRDGTELTDLDRKVEQVMRAIREGRAVIQFDADTETTTVVMAEHGR